MLELRRSNGAIIEAGAMSLPPIRSTRDAISHIHQLILIEMGDHSHENTSMQNNDVSGSRNDRVFSRPDWDGFCISSGECITFSVIAVCKIVFPFTQMKKLISLANVTQGLSFLFLKLIYI